MSARNRRNAIRGLDVDGMLIVSHEAKVAALTAYYSGILGGEATTRWDYDLDRLYIDCARAEAEPLIAPFTEWEARAVVRAMAADSALGPDGFGPGFYAVA